ncbi:MAG TPA: hypothetical protein DET40_06295 [Lentisphaeria bacterium]|nr:MAG: hypothetical protein A2X45_17835 [Lentisphaerae bacterium GWF2_50_93]HCE43137.1 hypothetical protein [Lentisphaeria bacterium]
MKQMISILSAVMTLFAFESPARDVDKPQPLSWAPPSMEKPATVEVSNENRDLKLDKEKDYIIKMPATPLSADGGLSIYGGRNVVLVGGEIRHDAPLKEGQSALTRRGIYIKGSTGTVHIEGLWITGENLAEGFNIDLRDNNILQIQNVRVDTVHGSREGHHADVIQTWAGPSELRIDRLTGSTTYQGFFLLPNQHFKGPAPKLFDLRRINLKDGGYLLWQGSEFPLRTEDVWADPVPGRSWPDLVLWPKGSSVWKDVKQGAPPAGDFVPAGVAGIKYVSPGYVKVDTVKP